MTHASVSKSMEKEIPTQRRYDATQNIRLRTGTQVVGQRPMIRIHGECDRSGKSCRSEYCSTRLKNFSEKISTRRSRRDINVATRFWLQAAGHHFVLFHHSSL